MSTKQKGLGIVAIETTRDFEAARSRVAQDHTLSVKAGHDKHGVHVVAHIDETSFDTLVSRAKDSFSLGDGLFHLVLPEQTPQTPVQSSQPLKTPVWRAPQGPEGALA